MKSWRGALSQEWDLTFVLVSSSRSYHIYNSDQPRRPPAEIISTAKLKVGAEAPDFTLPSQTGGDFTLSHLREHKNVVLYFYPKDGTVGCTKEACGFRDDYSRFLDMGAEVVGISSDSVERHRSFAANHSLPFTLLSDEKRQVRRLYGVKGTLGLLPGRVTFIIDKKGVVRHIFSSQFQPTQHIQEALRILKMLDAELSAHPAVAET